jgi:zinc-binding alcohol dehydrogenase family protein
MDTAIRSRAIVAAGGLPIDEPGVFVDTKIEIPPPGPHGLLVEVRAISVNPADTKIRASLDGRGPARVLGFDAAGVVAATAPGVSEFAVGDEVYYAGSDDGRPGSYAQYQLMDERLTGHKPARLDFAEAAAMPLTTLTAWEALFDKLAVGRESDETLLVVGGAGGVGSMVIQLARQLTGLTVIATASRHDSTKWASDLGAHHVIDRHDLAAQVRDIAPDGADYVFSPFSVGNIEAYADLLTSRGSVVAIDEPAGLDLLPLKAKSVTWHWELVWTRPLFEPDSAYHHDVLERVATLVDDRVLRSTMTKRLGPINAATIREAHREVEQGGMIGKLVVTA